MYCLYPSWCVLSGCVCMGAFYIAPAYLAFSVSGNLVVTVRYIRKNVISVFLFSDLKQLLLPVFCVYFTL